jgi:predicted permease
VGERNSWRRWPRIWKRDPQSEVDDELAYHLEQRVRDYVAQGMDEDAAREAVRERMGDMDRVRNECTVMLRGERRTHERRTLLNVSWLDVKLGLRMLVKYPGLSLVSVFGIALAIAIGAGGFGLFHAIFDATPTLDEGERLVSLQNADIRNPGNPDRHSLHDFLLWREEVRSVRDLSAFRAEYRNLDIPGGSSGEVWLARMTASGFRVARVAPALGRVLLDDDERVGAPPVIVIAFEEWQRRFEGDPHIIGRTVRIDTVLHTVVGVMPAGFRFPVNHQYWVPLQLDATAHAMGRGPEIQVFGRLADGISAKRAQGELTTIGRRRALAHPQTHEHLRPLIQPYTHPIIGLNRGDEGWIVRPIQLGLSLLLLVVSVNVAVLIYARTAARTGEIAVRTALGASRARVVTQLFAEALVLSAAGALVGIAMAAIGLDLMRELLTAEQPLPFWVNIGLSPATIFYAAALTVMAASIIGVFPALKVTSRSIRGSLQQLAARGSGLQLGRKWTTMIVVQVAVAVAVLPYALFGSDRLLQSGTARPDYPIDEFLLASLAIEREAVAATPDSAAREAAQAARFAAARAEVVRRLVAEPEVAAVTFASSFFGHEAYNRDYEIEGSGTRVGAWVNRVAVDLFSVLDVPVLAGRGFVPEDARRGSNAIIVDQAFVEEMLPGSTGLGRRVRERVPRPYPSRESDPGPWLEIVGVVPAFTPPPAFEQAAPKLYHPLALADATEPVLGVRIKRGSAPGKFLGRVREIARSVDPALQFRQLQTASEAERLLRKGFFWLALAVVGVTASVLLLSAAGMYAMMSFAVANRRREIGIRAALGASPRRVLVSIFRRALAQLGAGAVLGLLLAEAIPRLDGGSFFAGAGARMLPVIGGILLGVGLLAAFGPARRGLAIQPTEALRND